MGRGWGFCEVCGGGRAGCAEIGLRVVEPMGESVEGRCGELGGGGVEWVTKC